MATYGNTTIGGPGYKYTPTLAPGVVPQPGVTGSTQAPTLPQAPNNVATSQNIPYSPRAPYSGGSAPTGGSAGGSSYGGVSAVNPQAQQVDYDSLNPFINSAYDTAMTRLQPQIDQSRDRFDQSMIDRGMGVGNEGWKEGFQQNEGNINDALQSAAFGAMQFGTGIQDQMFGQDMARSGLANSLLQAKWGKDLGYAGLKEQGRQFNSAQSENARQFDASDDYRWDRAESSDLFGFDAIDYRNQAFNESNNRYTDSLMMSLLGQPMNPGGVDVNGAFGVGTSSGANNWAANQNNYGNWWDNLAGMWNRGG